MWDIDHFPGAKHVPWQLLIRARYVREIDAVLASTVVRAVGSMASVGAAKALAVAAEKALSGAQSIEASDQQRVTAMSAMLDWDGWCGTPWPHHWGWPPRRHDGFDELSDPLTSVLADHALEMVKVAGSEALQKNLGGALAKMAGQGAARGA